MKILFFLILNSYSSNFITCDVDVKFIKSSPEGHKIKIMKVKEGHTGFGDCGFKFGQVKDINLNEKISPKVGDLLKLEYSEYGGMGPNGPVHSKSWKVKKP